MSCPECGGPELVFPVPDTLAEYLPDDRPFAALCEDCLHVAPEDDGPSDLPDFQQVHDAFPDDREAAAYLAKGLREATVVNKHALRNGLISIVTILGLQMTALFSAIVTVEIVFAWPGLGRLALDAVLDRDYPLLQGTVLTLAVVVTFINLLVDMAYFFLDPRIEYA